MEIVATNFDTEKFFTLTNNQWEMCREVQSYTLCKISQPIHHKSNLCEFYSCQNRRTSPTLVK